MPFVDHNTEGANFKLTFTKRSPKDGKHQIERYMDDMFGEGHVAEMSQENIFVLKKNGVVMLGFKIVYIQGRGGPPNHSGLMKKFPDVVHVSASEVAAKLV